MAPVSDNVAVRSGGYGQFCPISRALDVVGERWSLLIVRDLVTGTSRFNDLARGLPGLSRSLLTKRLRTLERHGLIERQGSEYVLTEAGAALKPVVMGLGEWGAEYSFGDPDESELDPDLLAWWMHTGIDTADLPGDRTVFHLRFTDNPKQFWLVCDNGETSVCLVDPGFEVTASIVAGLGDLYQVWLGRLPLADAVRQGRVEFHGPGAVTRRMPNILSLSAIAPTVAASGSGTGALTR